MPGFWRTCRTAFRWCRFTLWTVLALALLMFAWLDLVGLPDFLKTRIISTLQDRGLDLQFTRMRFRPVHGFVVDQVRIGGMTDTNLAVFTAGELQLHLDYPALLHRQIQVDGLVVRNGKFILPVSPTNSLTWQNIDSTIRFLPGQTWAIDDLRSDFLGTRLQLAFQLAHAPEITNWVIFTGKKTAGPSSLAKPLKDFAEELQRTHFTGQPQFSLSVNGDARDVHSFSLHVDGRAPAVHSDRGSARDLEFVVRITSPPNAPFSDNPALSYWTNAYPFRMAWIARAARIDTPQISGEKIACSGTWAAPELKVTSLGGHIGGGTIESTAGLDVESRRLVFTNDSSFDPHLISFLLTPPARHQLSQILWTAPPSLKIGGSTCLPAWTNSQADWPAEILTNLSLAGTAGFSNAVVRATTLDLARVQFDYAHQMLTLSDAELDQGATKLALNGQQSLATKNFSFHLAGTLAAASVRPFLIGTRATNALPHFDFNAPLALDLAAAGNLDQLPDATAAGHLALTNFAIRQQTFGSVASDFNCSNRVIRLLHPQGYRASDSQYITADSITFDFNQWMMYFTNGYSTFEQMVIPRAIGPKTAGPIEPYHYLSPPTARVHGQLPIRDFKTGKDLDGTDLTFDVIRGAPFRWEHLYSSNITGTVRWMGQYLVLSNLDARCYNGEAWGHAYFDFTPVGYGCDFDFEVYATNLNVNLLACGLTESKTNRLEGLLSGHVAVTDANSKSWQSWDGYGSAELRDGLLWNIPLFGFFSPMLNSFTPGLGNSRATHATMSYVMTNGVARTDSLVIDTLTMRLQYAGTVDLQQNVNAHVTAQLLRHTWGVGAVVSTMLWPISKMFECRVTGLISDPKVTPVLLSPFRYTGGASATSTNSSMSKAP